MVLSSAAAAVAGITSCGDGGGTEPSEVVASVTIRPNTLSLTAGETHQLTAVPRSSTGAELPDRTITWTTSNAAVAVVSRTGLVTAVTGGSTTIGAAAEGRQGTADVTVFGGTGSILAFLAVATGGAHTCALMGDGAARCWGRGESGQLGATASATCLLETGPTACEMLPVAVTGGLTFDQITAGGSHTCALSGAGVAYCWGSNDHGQLGDNTTIPRQSPVAVVGGLEFETIDAGASHTCGRTSNGAAYCWGRNDRGQLGDGSITDRAAPVAVTGGLAFERITAGGFDIGHTCGIASGGAAHCWGDNELGQLGNGTPDIAPHPQPIAVAGGLTFVSLSAGLGRHSCGLAFDGAAYCWGENTFGGLGDGSTTSRPSPVAVTGGVKFAELKAGGFIGHTCGLTDTGIGYCWGENERGQIGDGSTTDRLSPVAVAGSLVFADVDAGFRHTCARTTDDTLYCWGSGAAGQLGINSTTQRTVPARVLPEP